MKRFFPKIYFVAELPLSDHEKMLNNIMGLTIIGFYHHSQKEIYVYTGPRPLGFPGQFSTLLHELCHWALAIIFGITSKLHDTLDQRAQKYYERKKING